MIKTIELSAKIGSVVISAILLSLQVFELFNGRQKVKDKVEDHE